MGVQLTANGPNICNLKCLLIDHKGDEVGMIEFAIEDLVIRGEQGQQAPRIEMAGWLLKGIQLDS